MIGRGFGLLAQFGGGVEHHHRAVDRGQGVHQISARASTAKKINSLYVTYLTLLGN
jgi:hypothetical protein